MGFNPTAVRPAAKAFLQTMAYIQELGVTESSGRASDPVQQLTPQPKREESKSMHHATATQNTQQVPLSAVVSPPAPGDLKINEPNLSVRGRTVYVEALLDFQGLTELEDQIKALKMILKPRNQTAANPEISDSSSESVQ
jgi:hypothetical protein